MPTKSKRRFALYCVVASFMTPFAAEGAPDLSDAGQAIYFGEAGSALEDATASIGGMDVALPADSFPCVSCHGELGVARAERGVTPPDISKDALTRAYRSTGARTQRPPYTLDSFGKALREGVDPAGNQLASSMPRFDLGDEDIAALWTYLDDLKQVRAPGVTDDTVLIGGFAPQKQLSAAQSEALEGTWTALISKTNARGGIHGRQIEFRLVQSEEEDLSDLFAILVPPMIEFVPEPSLPVIGGSGAVNLGSDSFRLVAGQPEQSAALAVFAASELGSVRVTDLVCGQQAAGVVLLSTPDCASDASGAEALLVPLNVFMKTPDRVRATWPEATYVALPQRLDRISPNAQAAFARLRQSSGLSRDFMILQADAYSTAVLAIEALVRSGRSITRSRFVAVLESLRGFDGAMTPALTFTANRRTGSTGANIVRFDPGSGQFVTDGIWIDPGAG